MVAKGRSDGRTVLIVPEVKDTEPVGITLLHVEFVDRLPVDTMRSVLEGYRGATAHSRTRSPRPSPRSVRTCWGPCRWWICWPIRCTCWPISGVRDPSRRGKGVGAAVIPITTPEEMRRVDEAAPEPVDVLIDRAGAALGVLAAVQTCWVAPIAGVLLLWRGQATTELTEGQRRGACVQRASGWSRWTRSTRLRWCRPPIWSSTPPSGPVSTGTTDTDHRNHAGAGRGHPVGHRRADRS